MEFSLRCRRHSFVLISESRIFYCKLICEQKGLIRSKVKNLNIYIFNYQNLKCPRRLKRMQGINKYKMIKVLIMDATASANRLLLWWFNLVLRDVTVV